jgi:cytochrome P450
VSAHDRLQLPPTNLEIPGDIVRINLMGQDIIFLNTAEAVSSLFQQKSHLYSNRPYFTFAGELVGYNSVMTLLDDGPEHREQRRLIAQEMGTRTALDSFTPMMEEKAREFICTTLDDPSSENLNSHIRT